VIDWTNFPETDTVISTVKFFKKQKAIIGYIRTNINRRKIYLKDLVDDEVVQFNEWHADMIMSEIKALTD
jgi:hypothetical protein